MNQSTATALAAISALRRGGVTDVVLAPGSRSAALAIALHEADARGLVRLHVRIDERSAGFLALGLAKGGHRPVPVVTTSGTAVANLHPAVLEAVHASVPLIVVSADRPARLRGTGANQTTDQVGVFGAAVPCVDVASSHTAAGVAAEALDHAVRRPGPTHVNLQFDGALVPDDESPALEVDPQTTRPDQDQRPARPWAATRADGSVRLPLGQRTVVVAGDDAGPPARLLAESANWPLLAEPTSGARTGTHALRTARLLLETTLADEVERVVVSGHPTLSRSVIGLISRADVEVISVRGPGGVCTDPGGAARHVDAMPEVDGTDPDGWVDSWRGADERLSAAIDEIADASIGTPLQVAAAVAAAVPPGGLLVVGSSQPVRDLDVMSRPYPAGERRLVIGNRGLAGIDGTVSTAIGAALGRPSPRSLAYLGDLTFLHDANGLVRGPREPRPDLTIVVANDDGGAVFSTLEQGAGRFAGSFERVFGTPHHVDIGALCAATGTPYQRVDDPLGLEAALAEADTATGVRVIEVPLGRDSRRDLEAQLREAATAAVPRNRSQEEAR
ncbi:MAG: 2-succinyl-5-enolpyruvyl-6-hydroxy-3-cyclohexene-1-carboxylic-acid synthase [Nocardioidaceae bacterium]